LTSAYYLSYLELLMFGILLPEFNWKNDCSAS
jgi:hypothetical protein